MAVPSAFYRPLIAAFEERGWEARALRSRGFERDEPSASRSNDWSYGDGILDVADAVAKARAENPDRPVVLLGHSIGAQIGAGHEINHTPCDGFIGVGAAIPWYKNYPYGGVPLVFMGLGVPVVSRLWGYVPKPFFGGPGARTLMNEWGRFIRTGRPPFIAEGPHATPSLIVHLQGDSFAPSNANKAYVDRFLTPALTTRWIYTKDAVPEGGTNDHVQWVRTPGPVADQIVTWWTTRP